MVALTIFVATGCGVTSTPPQRPRPAAQQTPRRIPRKPSAAPNTGVLTFLSEVGEESYDVEGNLGIRVSSDRWFRASSMDRLGRDLVAVYGTPKGALLLQPSTGKEHWSPFSGGAELSPNGRRVAWLSQPPEVLSATDLSLVERLEGLAESARWLGDDRLLLRSQEEASDLIELGKGRILHTSGAAEVSASGKYVGTFQLTRSPDEQHAAVGRFVVRRVEDDARVLDAELGFRDSFALAFSADERHVVFLGNDGTAHTFSLPSGRQRRVGKERPLIRPPPYNLLRAVLSDDGFVCAYTDYAKDISCEPEVLFNVSGALPRPPKGTRWSCFERGGGKAVVVPVPLHAQTSSDRIVLPSAVVFGASHCNRALSADQQVLAWFEARLDQPGGALEDLVLVIASARTLRPRHTVVFPTPRNTVNGLTLSLAFRDHDRLLEAEVDGASTRIDVKSGARLGAPQSKPGEHPGTPAMLDGVGPWSATGAGRSWDLRSFEVSRVSGVHPEHQAYAPGRRFQLLSGNVEIQDAGTGRWLATVRPLAQDGAVVRYPDGAVELVGLHAEPRLACRVDSRLVPLSECSRVRGRYARTVLDASAADQQE